ncbi:MAG: hypothetical protein AABX27_06080 [Nanoarchaeota archaeon]
MAKLLEERKVATTDLGTLLAKARIASESMADCVDLNQHQSYSCNMGCMKCNTYRTPQTKKNE